MFDEGRDFILFTVVSLALKIVPGMYSINIFLMNDYKVLQYV